MEEAKSAVESHIARNGERETSVHETVEPAVEHEFVQPTQHEKVYRPVDREIHKDHHHTKVQPIQHKQVLPEKHTHVQEGTEKREIQHGSDSHVQKRLKEEADTLGLHNNQREVGRTKHTRAAVESVEGEHVHHHVYEHIQPVIQKETVQPHVVHRTKPIHEVHQHEPEHHGASILPPVTLGEFERQGGSVHGSGGEERKDAFAGEPGRLGHGHGHIGGAGALGTTSLTHPEGAPGPGPGYKTYQAPSTRRTARGETPETYGAPSGTKGPRDTAAGDPDDGRGYDLSAAGGPRHRGADSRGHAASSPGTSGGARDEDSGVPRDALDTHGAREPTRGAGHVAAGSSHHKPSLMDKLNPMKDADGDGKAGFMT